MEAVLAGVVALDVQNHSLVALARAADSAGFSSTCVSFRGFRDIDSVVRAVREHRPRLFGLSIQSTEAALASATLIPGLVFRDKGGSICHGASSAVDSAPTCPDNLAPLQQLPALDSCGGFPAEVTFDHFGVPGAVYQVDAGMAPQDTLDCLQRLLAGYCFPSHPGTTQPLVSHHIWIA